jgi:hypothetical protein
MDLNEGTRDYISDKYTLFVFRTLHELSRLGGVKNGDLIK